MNSFSKSSFVLWYQQVNKSYKINETVNNSLLVGDKFITEINLRQLLYPDTASGSFTKNKNSKKQEIQDIFIKTN